MENSDGCRNFIFIYVYKDDFFQMREMVFKFIVENENIIQEIFDGDIQWGFKYFYEKKIYV